MSLCNEPSASHLPPIPLSFHLLFPIIANQYFSQIRPVRQSVNYLLQVRQTTENASVRRLLVLSYMSSRPTWMCCNSKTCWRNELTWLLVPCPFQISGGTRRQTLLPTLLLLSLVSTAYPTNPPPCAQTRHTNDQTEPTEGGLKLASKFWLWRRHFKQISLDNNRQGILAVAT